MPGKASTETLTEVVFDRTGATDEAVRQGPAVGEDAAAIEIAEETLVVSSDPISLAASHVGTLGVAVACNDVAVSGVQPRWLTVVVLLPPDGDLASIVTDIDSAATDAGVAVVGGHTEEVDALDRPTVSLTAMGVGEWLPTHGVRPGDAVLLTKGAGIEGTAILAADFGEALSVDADIVARGESFLEEVSLLPDARALRPYARAMHDPTEGGVLAGLRELAIAGDVEIEIDRSAVPVREETRVLAAAAGVDPLQIFGSGAVLATVPQAEVEQALSALHERDLEAAVIGEVTGGAGHGKVGDQSPEESTTEPELIVNGAPVRDVTDNLYDLWAERDS